MRLYSDSLHSAWFLPDSDSLLDIVEKSMIYEVSQWINCNGCWSEIQLNYYFNVYSQPHPQLWPTTKCTAWIRHHIDDDPRSPGYGVKSKYLEDYHHGEWEEANTSISHLLYEDEHWINIVWIPTATVHEQEVIFPLFCRASLKLIFRHKENVSMALKMK